MDPSAPDTSQMETFIEAVAFSYLQSSIEEHDNKKIQEIIKGRYPKIKYTTHGYDVKNLTYDEKVDLINKIFETNEVYGQIKSPVQHLEKVILRVKDRLGVVSVFDEILRDLPAGVFEAQKIKILSKEDLEEELLRVSNLLTEARVSMDKTIEERTLALTAEKEMFQATLDSTNDGVFALNMDGKIVTFNRTMEKLTGYSYAEVKMTVADDVIRLFEETAPLPLTKYSPLTDSLSDKIVYSSGKVTLVARNGSKKTVRLVSAVISEGKRVNLRCIVTLTDITSESELESMKLDFVSIAAHELRTPITAFRGYLSLLKDESADSLSAEHQKYLEKSIISAENLYVLMENLLNISRIERGQLVLERVCVDWKKVVNSAIERFKENANMDDITFEYVLPSNSPQVIADEIMITEAFSNFIDNGIRYNKKGGKITITVEESDGYVITHVKDTGIGIPQESIPHIFKKFYRVSGVLEQGKKGTGLGLFIAREVIRLHGGEVWVDSKVGVGTTFNFKIPSCKEKNDGKN